MATSRPPAHATEPLTPHLRLRRIRQGDLDRPDVLRWHVDAEGYALMNEEPYSEADAREIFGRWVEAWDRDGYGYWLAERRDSGQLVGIGGIRKVSGPGGEPYNNLYYRLDPAARGEHLATEIAAAAAIFAYEWLPGMHVACRINPRNEPSLHTALRAGMRDIGEWREPSDPEDQPPSRLLRGPDVLTEPVEPGSPAYDDLARLWNRTRPSGQAGQAVGRHSAPAAPVELDKHLSACAAGSAHLVRLAEPTLDSWDDRTAHGPLLGVGLSNHVPDGADLVVDPAHEGSNLDELLAASLRSVQRAGV
ncbi:GNAT family N-acetyltransferase [Luteipulveratus mongoliensis]|uniref:GNAT family N-acetyltransferase n=1 Tax=Luteipulveratus mongoliensis TaxID=571913 RepID=UPI000698C39F|nr:GNAT family N-acetyltransferase [Luteipulveratus mongoliensis]